MTAYEMSVAFYDLFFHPEARLTLRDYLDHSFCDEMGEIDLKRDKFTMFYHVEGKYFSPSHDGTFSHLYPFILEHIVHPEDRDIYSSLMDPEHVLENLENSPERHFAFIHMRYKLQDGSWRYVEQAVISGKENGLPEGVIRFYVFDIHNAKVREKGQLTSDESNLFEKSRDETTGLYREKAFFAKIDAALKRRKKNDFAMLSIDIEHFKLFDEWYGRETGNFLLASIGTLLRKHAERLHGYAGYFGQDDFAFLCPNVMEEIEKIYADIRGLVLSFGFSVGFLPGVGVARLSDFKDARDAFDRASIAATRAKKDLKKRIYVYDVSMQAQSEKEYHQMLAFMEGLKNGEATFFLQPQVRLSNGKIVGAEALARWVKKDGTVVPPMEFIPVLEKFGFIADLDKVIWEQVVAWIKELVDRGIKPVPISLNVSQADIFLIDIPAFFKELLDKYQINPKYIKIEITESAYAQNMAVVDELVRDLRKMGFTLLLDDFGSGYSSLNMLSSVKVDVIKLDAQFLRLKNEDLKKGIHILESVVNMAKSIAIPMIVEGIETLEQKDFLEGLGCRYAQGFYFYRPVTKEAFAKMLCDEKSIDPSGFVVKINEQFRVREFLDKNIYSDAMLNNILGAVAFYAWEGGERVDIIRFNEQFYATVDVPDFQQRLTNIQRFMPEEDKPKLYYLLQEAMDKRLTGSTGVLHFYKTDGSLSTYIMKFYYTGDKEGSHRFYGSANNITNFATLQSYIKLITKYTSDTFIFLAQTDGKFKLTVAAHGLSEVTGLTMEELQDQLDDRSFYKHFDSKADKAAIATIQNSVNENKPFSMPLRFTTKKGEHVRLHIRGDFIDDATYNVKYIITLRLWND